MLVRNHPDAAATLEGDFEDSDTKFEKIEHAVKGVGERVKRVEEEVTQFEGAVHEVVLDIGYHADDIADVQDRVDSLSQAVPFSNFSEEEVQFLKKASEKERLSSDGIYRRTLLLRNFRNRDYDYRLEKLIHILSNV